MQGLDPITRRVLAARAPLRRLLAWCAVLLPLACLVVAAALRAGAGAALPGVGARPAAAARFLALYAAPLMLAAPLWARGRLVHLERLAPRTRALDVGVTVLALARFVAGAMLPFSGHMLFLTYTALARPGDRGYCWLAAVLLAETTVFKLWLWRDPTSWGMGLALGLLAAWAARGDARRAII